MLDIAYGVSGFIEYEQWLNSPRLKILTQYKCLLFHRKSVTIMHLLVNTGACTAA